MGGVEWRCPCRKCTLFTIVLDFWSKHKSSKNQNDLTESKKDNPYTNPITGYQKWTCSLPVVVVVKLRVTFPCPSHR